MICDRCGEPIKGEAEVIPAHAPSGAAPDIYLHPYPCHPTVPRQTAPADRW
ncbi:hypothetical protein [Streptomyces sp. NPDC047453]|uniref:hypothetical protein n=1 Tax=Streptomyces sp. NPDC047453 TaxID=3154812 RepID=UPI0033D58D25